MCCRSSSASDASRWGSRRSGTSAARTSAVKSGMFEPRDAVDGEEELLPGLAMRGEGRAAVGGEAVVAPAPLSRLFHPAAVDESALLESQQQRVERRGVEGEHALRLCGDQLAQLVAVSRLFFQKREEQELCAALLHRQFEHR